MKKLFTTLLIFLGCHAISHAQQEAGTVEFGLNAGFNGSYVTVTNSGYQDSGYKGGFTGGISADYYFSEKWSLKVRASYDQKGWGNGYVTTDDGMGNTTETNIVSIKVNYITVPILANLHFGRQRQWYLGFGPYIGILTSASGGGLDLKDAFTSADAGLDVNIGIKFPVSDRFKFFIEVDGQGGLTDIDKNNSGFGNITNQRTSLNIGLNF